MHLSKTSPLLPAALVLLLAGGPLCAAPVEAKKDPAGKSTGKTGEKSTGKKKKPDAPQPADPATPAKPDAPAPAPAAPAEPVSIASEEAAAKTAAGLSTISQLLPVGKTTNNVKVPAYGKDGKITSKTTIGTVTHTDEENFHLEDLILQTSQPDGTPGLRVEVTTGSYHAPTHILKTEVPSRMSHPQFEVVGETMVFDDISRVVRWDGRVIAHFFDEGPAPQAKPEK